MGRKGFTLVELLVVIVILGVLAGVGVLAFRDSIFQRAYEADVETANRILTNALYFALLDGIDIEEEMGDALGLSQLGESGLFTIDASKTEYFAQWSPNVIIDPEHGPENEFYFLRVRDIEKGSEESNILAKRKWSLHNDED